MFWLRKKQCTLKLLLPFLVFSRTHTPSVILFPPSLNSPSPLTFSWAPLVSSSHTWLLCCLIPVLGNPIPSRGCKHHRYSQLPNACPQSRILPVWFRLTRPKQNPFLPLPPPENLFFCQFHHLPLVAHSRNLESIFDFSFNIPHIPCISKFCTFYFQRIYRICLRLSLCFATVLAQRPSSLATLLLQ